MKSQCIAPLRIQQLLPLSVLLLSGCATFSGDGGFSTVQSLVKERTNQEATKLDNLVSQQQAKSVVKAKLAKVLTVDDAVTIALLNNQALQASYQQLGIAEANLIQSGRIKNPGFSFEKLKQGHETQYDRTLMFSLLDLLVMPTKQKIESHTFEQAKIQAAADALQLINDTRQAYYLAVAAKQSIHYREEVKIAAEASSDLADEMVKKGNTTQLQEAQKRLFLQEAELQLLQAEQNYRDEREKLIRFLGLSGADIHFKLPDRLPDIPQEPRTVFDAESQAMQQRLDLLKAKQELSGLANSLDLTNQTRFVNVLSVGYLNNNYRYEPTETGYAIEFELPIFDSGDARIAKEEAIYQQAVNRAAQMAINAQSEVRNAYSNYQSSYLIAKRYRDQIIPLQKQISDEKLLRYNGMLISVFDLLENAQDQAEKVNAAIDAQRDFWLADAALQMAMVGESADLIMTSIK